MARVDYKLYYDYECIYNVGLTYEEDEPIIVYPSFLDKQNFKRNTLLLLSVLEKYYKTTRYSQNTNSDFGSGKVFYTYIWLIKDFFENGLYQERVKVSSKREKGKIDFQKTIRKELPLKSQNNYVYQDFYVKKSAVNANNKLKEIQANAVKSSIDYAGFLLNIKANPLKFAKKISAKEAINELHRCLNNTNNDKDIQLINKLLIFYDNESIAKNKEISKNYLGVSDFNNVFNEMINYMFSNIDISEFLKMDLNLIDKGLALNDSKEIIRKTDKLYFISSQYTKKYAIIPCKSSIYKQYAFSKKIDSSAKNIIFICDNLNDKKYEYLGYAKVEKENILFIKIDLSYVMRYYISYDYQEIFDNILSYFELNFQKE